MAGKLLEITPANPVVAARAQPAVGDRAKPHCASNRLGMASGKDRGLIDAQLVIEVRLRRLDEAVEQRQASCHCGMGAVLSEGFILLDRSSEERNEPVRKTIRNYWLGLRAGLHGR